MFSSSAPGAVDEGQIMRSQPIIHAFFDEPTNTVTYIVADPADVPSPLFNHLVGKGE
jgi:hypothetical protein